MSAEAGTAAEAKPGHGIDPLAGLSLIFGLGVVALLGVSAGSPSGWVSGNPLLGRALLAIGAGALLGFAGALRFEDALRAGRRQNPLAEAAMLAAALGAASAGAVAASIATGGLAAFVAFAVAALPTGALLYGGVLGLDRANRASNIALALALAAVGLAASFVFPLVPLREASVATAYGWLMGDLSRATPAVGSLLLAGLAVATALAASRVVSRATLAAVSLGAGIAAAGPLAGLAGLAPRGLRFMLRDLSDWPFALASAAIAGVAAVAIDGFARWLIGAFAPPFNLCVLFLTPLFLLWNRQRLVREVGEASRAAAILEWTLIAGLAALSVILMVVHRVIVLNSY